MPGQPLPDNPFPDSSMASIAYNKCLHAELEAINVKKPQTIKLVAPRILGSILFLLHSSAKLGALRSFADEVGACASDAAIVELGKRYNQCFINVFKRSSGSAQPSEHPSLQEHDVERTKYTEMAQNSSLDHRKSKEFALERDDHRCLLTHATHTAWALLHPDKYDGGTVAYTQAAHIIPECINHGISANNKGGKKHVMASDIRRVLNMFGERPIPDELDGNNVHRLENILTLTRDIHERFDRLQLWLKAVPDEPYKYRVVTSHLILHQGIDDIVEFKTTDDKLPLPDATYLELHALACEVAHMSGAAEYLDKMYDDLERTHLLAQDGSSVDLLDRILTLVAPTE